MNINRLTIYLSLLSMPLAVANAEVVLNESFIYTPGNLNSQGQWVTNGVAGSNAINVCETSLTHDGYQDVARGNAVALDMESGKNSVQIPFNKNGLTSIYYSALVRVDEFPSSLGKPGGIITLTGENTYEGTYGDGIVSSEGGALFVRKGSSDSKAQFGISVRNSSNGMSADQVQWATAEFDLGQPVLIVMHYTMGADENSDSMELYVNPTAESTTPDAVSTNLERSLMSIRGVALCQRSALTSKIPAVTIDELRGATELDEIFRGDNTQVTVPNFNFSINPLDFGQVYTGITQTRSLRVYATDLTADITVNSGESGQVSVEPSVIDKEAAMGPDGAEVTVTLSPVESRFYSDRITFTSEGAADKTLNVQWHPVSSLVASTIAELCDEDSHDMVSVYVYTGQATVTFVESYYDLSYDRVVNSIFAQDATGGFELRSATGCGYQEIDISGVEVGDNLTNVAGYLIFGDSGLTFIPRTPHDWEVVSKGNEVLPIELTLRELAMAPDGYTYGNQLVKVNNIRFLDDYYYAGDYYGLWNSQKYQIFDGTLDEYDGMAWMWCNKGADYFKQSSNGYFDHFWNLTGILNNYYPIHVSPRSYADFEDMGQRDMSSVDELTEHSDAVSVCDLWGRNVDSTFRGIVIARMADGSVHKMIKR